MAKANSTARKNRRDQQATPDCGEFMRLVVQLTEAQRSLALRYMRYLAARKPGTEAMPIAKFIETLPQQLIDQFRPLVMAGEVHHG